MLRQVDQRRRYHRSSHHGRSEGDRTRIIVEGLSGYRSLDHDLGFSPAWTSGNYNNLAVPIPVMVLKVPRAFSSEHR